MRNSGPVGEALQREIEKSRIREEILAEEIIRRRTLEAEVRRELAMERGLSIRREEGFSLVANSSCPSMWSDPRGSLVNHFNQHHHHPDDSRVLEESLSLSSRPDVAEVESFPFQRHPDAANKVTEMSKRPGGPVLFIAKPTNPNLAGIKRKVAAVGGMSELALGSSKKKPQKEWSCALCQVSATSEQGLNDHLKGKKHRAREAEFRANGAASKDSDSSTTSPRESDKSELAKISSSPEPDDGKMPVQSKQLVKKNREAAVQKKQKPEDLKKRFKFWCEHCQIGCHSATVLADHKRGKKHIARLQATKQDGKVVLATTTTTTTTTEATAGKEEAVEEANEEIIENVDGEVDGGEEAQEEEALQMKATVNEVAEAEKSF
ncbi:zinc finger protein [Macleaya cordata]|uniref:Zinc finger protein n=1 Tax=Macleaya cordata TaxID=56857 RepID=A0A200QFH3_MACCD|nr:zinc finger protein [Macleaya cordata]